MTATRPSSDTIRDKLLTIPEEGVVESVKAWDSPCATSAQIQATAEHMQRLRDYYAELSTLINFMSQATKEYEESVK